MSFIKNFPKTTFTLPSGYTVSAVNILKTFVISETTKSNTEILNKTNGVYTNKIENLNYEFYGNKPSLYWTLLYLNDIDSFTSCPIPQSKFESNLSNRYPGKAYYIKDAIDAGEVIKGDMVILYTVSDGITAWRTAGIVKEYDSKFRRIIIEKEYENAGATANFAGGLDTFYNTGLEVRRKNQDSWEPIGVNYTYPDGLTVGRVEDEKDKILELYEDGLDGREVSPYQIISGSNYSSDYDFTATGPTAGTVLYKLSGENPITSPVSELYFYTVLKDEVRKNTNTNSINHLSVGRAFRLNTFVVNLLKTNFKRGQEITIT
tara:strand:+ start:530 stop:1486 length:957 start_codon:yes stop_codon:yes gene_type:complete